MFLPLAGDPACLRSNLDAGPQEWLPDAQPLEDGRWSVRLHGAGWSQVVAMRIGAPWSSTNTRWRSLSWEPLRAEDAGGDRPLRHLPTFDGEVGLFTSERVASLAIEGRYRAPGGPLGAMLDGLALHRVARSTANRLLADIGVRLRAPADGLKLGSAERPTD